MISIRIFILVAVFLSQAIFARNMQISYKKALTIPSVKEFKEQTGLETEPYLKKALKNKHWINANLFFVGFTIKAKMGTKEYRTLPYRYIIYELQKASEEGITLATFQGYRLSSIISRKETKYAKKDTSWFSKKMMEEDICLGYIETAYGYSRGWYGAIDWKKANKIIKAGKNQCKNGNLAFWVKGYYGKYSAQYSAMSSRK